MQLWSVWICNNYYAGKYYEWSARPFNHIIANSEEEAKQVVLDNRHSILEILKQKRVGNGRKLLSKQYTLPIEKLGKVSKGLLISTGKVVDFFSPNGIIKAQIKDGEIFL